MNDNIDYIIKSATYSEWQKWLNQWKHTYEIEILKIKFDTLHDNVSFAIKRIKI